jgi:hypothetical protein
MKQAAGFFVALRVHRVMRSTVLYFPQVHSKCGSGQHSLTAPFFGSGKVPLKRMVLVCVFLLAFVIGVIVGVVGSLILGVFRHG